MAGTGAGTSGGAAGMGKPEKPRLPSSQVRNAGVVLFVTRDPKALVGEGKGG